jgi:hypothetical protein
LNTFIHFIDNAYAHKRENNPFKLKDAKFKIELATIAQQPLGGKYCPMETADTAACKTAPALRVS